LTTLLTNVLTPGKSLLTSDSLNVISVTRITVFVVQAVFKFIRMHIKGVN
jgi:hypothetical protein